MNGKEKGSDGTPNNCKRKKPVKLTPIEKKKRDKIRKREQQQLRLNREKKLLELISLQQNEKNASVLWIKKQARQQEELILKQELDDIDPREEHPSSAGYNLTTTVSNDSAIVSPIFRGISLTSKLSMIELKHKKMDVAKVHPSSWGYLMIVNCSENISPVFFKLDFKKKEVLMEDDNDLDEFDEEFNNNMKSESQIKDNAELSLQCLMNSRFDEDVECMICESSKLPGCPGCWIPPDLNCLDTINKDLITINNPNGGEKVAELPNLFPFDGTIVEISDSNSQSDSDDYDSGDEQAFMDNLLLDECSIKKFRSSKKHYLHVIIKSVPMGSVVQLYIDTKSSVKYLYDLYRSNFDDPNRKIILLLPTSIGVFVLDETIQSETEITTAIINGTFTLEDYNIFKSHGQHPLVLLSVTSLHPKTTPQMIMYYLSNNFSVNGSINLTLRYAAAGVPKLVFNDIVQLQLSAEATDILNAALENKRISKLYDEAEKQKALRIAFDEKMKTLGDQRKRQKLKPTSKKETRAKMYLKFAVGEIDDWLRLEKLWQCFQKYEDLKICKNAKLLDASRSTTMVDIFTSHNKETKRTFNKILGIGDSPLPHSISYLGNGKLGLYVGKRYGINEKADRDYGIEIELDCNDRFSEQCIKLQKHKIREAILEFTDMEWCERQVVDTILSSGDLVLNPFHRVKWDNLACGYLKASKQFTVAKKYLDIFNSLVFVIKDETVLSKKEINNWCQKITILLNELGPTGFLSQASRTLLNKKGILKNIAATHKKKLKRMMAEVENNNGENKSSKMEDLQKFKLECKNQMDSKLAYNEKVNQAKLASKKGLNNIKAFAKFVKEEIEFRAL